MPMSFRGRWKAILRCSCRYDQRSVPVSRSLLPEMPSLWTVSNRGACCGAVRCEASRRERSKSSMVNAPGKRVQKLSDCPNLSSRTCSLYSSRQVCSLTGKLGHGGTIQHSRSLTVPPTKHGATPRGLKRICDCDRHHLRSLPMTPKWRTISYNTLLSTIFTRLE